MSSVVSKTQRGYRFTSLDELVRSIRDHGQAPPRSVQITFDDGWSDNHRYAFPLLRERGLSATFFVATGHLAERHADPRWISADQLRELTDAGMTIGSHTRSHAILTRLAPDAAADEIAASRGDLEGLLDREILHLAYPGGAFDARLARQVQQAGYASACSVLGPAENDRGSLYWLFRDVLSESMGQAERARRVEAETLREVLEAINRQARLKDTIDEVLRQLSRIVVFDSCRLALLEPDGRFRILAVRGVDESKILVGEVYQDALSDEIRETRWPVSVTDVEADERLSAVQTLAGVRSWAGIPLLVEGEVIGLLSLSRHCVDAFQEEDLHRAKAVAFSAAAAIRKARLLEQVRRYAALMERAVAVDQAVFAGQPPEDVARVILDGPLGMSPISDEVPPRLST